MLSIIGYSKWSAVQQRLCLLKSHSDGLAFSSMFILALVEGEDRRFWQHKGVDLLAIAAVPWRAIRNRQLSGASTITQQLVRMLTGDYSRSIFRKLNEMALALLLETRLRKIEIARLYLTLAYFGSHMTGIAQACARLDIDPEQPSLFEACSVIARLKYPQPKTMNELRLAKIRRRASWILRRLSSARAKAGITNATILDVTDMY
jgi:penicillin-binding protein 1A